MVFPVVFYKDFLNPIFSNIWNLKYFSNLKVKYNWKPNNPANIQPTAKLNIGFLAQEVGEVFPEMVEELKSGYQGVKYAQFAPILVEAIKEQQIIIEEQASKIKNLERHAQEMLDLREKYDQQQQQLIELRERMDLLLKEIRR